MQGNKNMNAPAPSRTGVQLKGFPGAGLTASSTITVWYWVGLGLGCSSLPPPVLKNLAAFAPSHGFSGTTPTERACCMRDRIGEIIFVLSQILEALICVTLKLLILSGCVFRLRGRYGGLRNAGSQAHWWLAKLLSLTEHPGSPHPHYIREGFVPVLSVF